jgi:iron(III) transport system substrate-binding protein
VEAGIGSAGPDVVRFANGSANMNPQSRTAGCGRRFVSFPASVVIGAIAVLSLSCAGAGTGGTTSSPGGSSSVGPSGSSGSPQGSGSSATIRLYTSVTQTTVDAVVAGFKSAHPGVAVDVFRAPTGELAARIAAELRDGRIRGDLLWLTDPLSIQGYAAQGLLRTWQPAAAAGIGDAYQSNTFWGTRFLNMVMVRGSSVTPVPAAWKDLTSTAYKGAIAMPDPGFAGSAFGTLAYFAQSQGFGLDFYRSLKANGAAQVKSPDEVTAGVAEGRFKVGITIDNSVRTAVAKGSPVELVWPTDGAIAMYSPIGVVGATANPSTSESFVEFVLSDPGQQAIAKTGWQTMRADSGGPTAGGKQVYPDWTAAFGHQQDLLTEYRAIFGG